MLSLILCGLLFTITSYVEGKSDYDYYPEAKGWLKLHKVRATWQQAFLQCHAEGAVLASPLTKELWQVMQELITDNNSTLSYYIGANSLYSPGEFVSIEGVPLARMPINGTYQVLDLEDGDCLRTTCCKIDNIPCTMRLPYICYKEKKTEAESTSCGTFDPGYVYEQRTDSCYKVHMDIKTWPKANSLCISEGAHLVVLNNAKEAEIITAMFPPIELDWYVWEDKSMQPLYIGLRAWNGNDTWLTVQGQPLDEVFNEWDNGQPDATGQQCGAIDRHGKLDNVFCDKPSVFVCEKKREYVRFSYMENPGDLDERFSSDD